MAEQFHHRPFRPHFGTDWESFAVANTWRSNGLAQRLREQLFDPYVESYLREPEHRGLIERPLSQIECAEAALELQQQSDVFHRFGSRFLKFVAIGLAGVMTRGAGANAPKEKLIFVEFGANEADDRLGLPSALPASGARGPGESIQPARLEVFSCPVGIVVHKRTDAQRSEVKFLYSARAYDDAHEHLNIAATEVGLWRKRSPFVDFKLLTERSNLFSTMITQIEDEQRLRDQAAFVLAIKSIGFLGPDQIELAVYVGHGDHEKLLQSPESMQVRLKRYRISSDHSGRGTVDFDLNQLTDEPADNFSDESLREASHIWLLKHKRTAARFGIEQTVAAFAWEQRDQDRRDGLKFDSERFDRLLGD